jgi:CDP-diacylglycerol---glycerol-3-phosphate 3-phosphatidyltransferase
MLLESRAAGVGIPESKVSRSMENIRDSVGVGLRKGFRPFLSTLHKVGVTPNQITTTGTILNGGVAVLVVFDHLIWAGILLLVAGLFDMLDGSLARLTHKVTPFGAFLDSSLDRVSEGMVLAGVAYFLAAQGGHRASIDAALVVLALLGSILVSYTRARAESLGVECKSGIMTRPERVILVAIGLFFNVLPYVIYIMLALTAFTVIQRIVHTYRELGRKREQGGSVEQ